MKNIDCILVVLYDISMEVAEAFDMPMVTRTQLYAWQPQDGGLALTKIQLTSFPIFPPHVYRKKVVQSIDFTDDALLLAVQCASKSWK